MELEVSDYGLQRETNSRNRRSGVYLPTSGEGRKIETGYGRQVSL
jgi:hypothetical protein